MRRAEFSAISTLAPLVTLVTLVLSCGVDNAPGPQTAAGAVAGSVAGVVDGGASGESSEAPDSVSGDDTVDKRVANIKASFIAQDAHDASGVAAFFTTDAVIKSPGTADWKGRDLIRAEEQKAFDESPDVKFGARRILVDGDVAIVEWTATGTATLTRKTGARPYGANGVSVMWFGKDNLIREEHDILNAPTVIAQTGAGKGKVREVLLQPSGTPDVRVSRGTPDEAKNAEIARAFDKALEAHDDKTWSDLFADDVAWDDYSSPAPLSGRADVTQAFAQIVAALPDLKIVCRSWAMDDIVVKECVRTATHEGTLPLGSLKVPATHRFTESHYVDILQMKRGKIAKGVRYADNLEMATELGLVGAEKTAPSPAKKKK